VRLGLEDPRLLPASGSSEPRSDGMCGLAKTGHIERKSEDRPRPRGPFDRAKRKSLEDVLLANFKRAEDRRAVLEEVLKVVEPELARKVQSRAVQAV